MNELMYSFRNNGVRVFEKDGEAWFLAKDVCTVLSIVNIGDALSRLEDDEKADIGLSDGRQIRKNKIVNESGLYNLIFSSRKQEAKDFKRWVTHEVLPSIRKNGIYATPKTVSQMLDDPQFLIDTLNKLKDEQRARKAAETKVAILTHVNKLYTATEIAKECGMRSANELNKKLKEMKIQYNSNGTWVLGADYSELGYVSIKQSTLDNGTVVYDRKFTQTGREWLLELFKAD